MKDKSNYILEHLEALRDKGYERIADRLDILWGTVECDKYLWKLLIDERGSRDGFAIDVFDDLLGLCNAHTIP